MEIVKYSAPARIDLSGGATDWCGMHTLSMAINLRASAKVQRIENKDLIQIKIGNLEEEYIKPTYGTDLDLFKAVIELSKQKGFRIEYETQIPKGSGLGGSAPLTVSTLFALNNLFSLNWSKYYIAELAQRAESYKLQTVNGHQDQYSAVFGGLIYMDFEGKTCQKGIYSKTVEEEPYATVESLDEYMPDFHIIIAIPQITRASSDETNSSVSEKYLNNDPEIVNLMKEKAKLTQLAKKLVIEKKETKLYEVINQNNEIMRKFGFLTEDNELIIKKSFEMGALACKTTGAGKGAVAIFARNKELTQKIFEALKRESSIKHLFIVKKDEGARKEKI